MAEAAIELIGIDKSFGTVRANRDINLTIERGTIRGIVGENGAGKSTLMSILYGFYQADGGDIRVNGRPAAIRAPNDAIRLGIGMEVLLFRRSAASFVVAENDYYKSGGLPGECASARCLVRQSWSVGVE